MFRLVTVAFLPMFLTLLLGVAAFSKKQDGAGSPESAATPGPDAAAQRNVEEGQGLVLLRGLPTLGTKHSVAIVELDPEAANFGEILQEFELPDLEMPLERIFRG